jgi:hypothetical protein
MKSVKGFFHRQAEKSKSYVVFVLHILKGWQVYDSIVHGCSLFTDYHGTLSTYSLLYPNYGMVIPPTL